MWGNVQNPEPSALNLNRLGSSMTTCLVVSLLQLGGLAVSGFVLILGVEV